MRILPKNTVRLLKLFYAHPDKQFYMQEIGRILGKKPGVFQRSLNSLHSDGLLLSEYKANARFFSINKRHPIYSELKSIISKTAKTCLIMLFLCAPSLRAEENTLTLKDTILIAFKNNKDIQIQEKQIDYARANIVYARSKFLPDVNLNVSYTHNDKVMAEDILLGFHNENQVGVSFNETLYNGGADIANYKQSLIGLKAEWETLRAKKLDIEFEAKRLYYGLLLAYETERIAREALEQSKAHYEDVKNKYSQGTASRFDVLQSGVQVSLLVPNLIKASNEVNIIKAELNKLLGRDVYTAIATDEKLGYSAIEIEEQNFLKTTYLNKPEMILKSLGIDIDKWGIQMAKAGYRPQLTMDGNYFYTSKDLGHIFSSNKSNWYAGIALTIPIFEGFSTKAKVDEAKARYTETVLSKENLANQIAVDVRQACLNLKESQAIIDSQKDHVDEAREALKIAEISYDNGVGTNLDVIDAQVSLSQIQQNLASGIYDYLMAEAYLKRNMGESFVKEAGNEKKS